MEEGEIIIDGIKFRWLQEKSDKNFSDSERGLSHADAAKLLMERELGAFQNPSPNYPHQSLSICSSFDGNTNFTIVHEDGHSVEHGEYTFIITLWKTTKPEERRL